LAAARVTRPKTAKSVRKFIVVERLSVASDLSFDLRFRLVFILFDCGENCELQSCCQVESNMIHKVTTGRLAFKAPVFKKTTYNNFKRAELT
jgi:hypothetical protein